LKKGENRIQITGGDQKDHCTWTVQTTH
jgi:hypothetical protein